MALASEAQAITKMTKRGWRVVRGKLLCATCEANRRAIRSANNDPEPKPEPIPALAEETKPVKTAPATKSIPASTSAPRQPTREQKRQIMSLLDGCYDVALGRYTGGDTDKTVADAMGEGIPFGWVAQIREEFFGPSGGNDDMAEVQAELAAALSALHDLDTRLGQLKAGTEHLKLQIVGVEREMGVQREVVQKAQDRIEKLVKAVGAKAQHV